MVTTTEHNTVKRTYTLTIHYASAFIDWPTHYSLMVHGLPEMLKEVEENLTDLLPEGYSAQIREWDQEDDE